MLDSYKQADSISEMLHHTQKIRIRTPIGTYRVKYRKLTRVPKNVSTSNWLNLSLLFSSALDLANKDERKQQGGREAHPSTFCPHRPPAKSQPVCYAQCQQLLQGSTVRMDRQGAHYGMSCDCLSPEHHSVLTRVRLWFRLIICLCF